MAARKKPRKTRSKKISKSKPLGWKTSDEDEVVRRTTRGEKESFTIKLAKGRNEVFADWFVTGESGETHRVEIRSAITAINSCSCKDFQINGLGTCKHIEGVLYRFRKRKRKILKQGSPHVEIYLDRSEMSVKVSFPERMREKTRVRQVVSTYFDTKSCLRGDPLQSMAALKDKLNNETSRIHKQLRISVLLEEWLSSVKKAADQHAVEHRFKQDLKQGRTSLDMVKLPLYPYQQEGMMHLAFTGRALLADEMGLGKTVQAIAGSVLLSRLHSIKKVLVISPASLKSEWLEQIDKFSDRESLIIQGMRKRRYKLYQQTAFFYLANYEQILYDKDFINDKFKPDLIILDEAQRIKNWQTKTAAAIKQLQSPYAFVLTGTPLENRIDEIYSITQFLDPSLFGPLFRFNRDFHELDEKGFAVGYKNLDQLHERLRPIMLRRRKEDVEGELPERSDNNYFVQLTEEQEDQYGEHHSIVARLSNLAQKRPLKQEERQRLMIALACMRMACDTPYILDQGIRHSPKLDELEKLLEDLFTDPDCKILVFSEWTRMLTLLAERLTKAGIDYAWHTGSVTQKKRREEINRFKEDPQCRLFLATDSAATGLNLQAARVVVNLDLPWNPAKLEQRIARAWRKHQKHPVAVINLVSENTIEHRMLDVLRHKTDLADEVVDGKGKITDMKISAGRGSFMERLDDLLGESEPKRPPLEKFTKKIITKHPDRVTHLEQRGNTILAVVDSSDEPFASEMQQHLNEHFSDIPPQLEMLDQATFETLQRLAEAGIIQFTQSTKGQIYDSKTDSNKEAIEKQRRQMKSQKSLKAAEEKQRMSQLLADGGFITEALAPLNEALNKTLAAAAIAAQVKADDPLSISQISSLQRVYKLPEETIAIIAMLRHERDDLSKPAAKDVMDSAKKVMLEISSVLTAS